MKNIWILKDHLTVTYPTSGGGNFKMMNLGNHYCPNCSRALHVRISRDNPEYAVVDECECNYE